MTFISDDEILVADKDNQRIQQFNVQTGNFVNSFGRWGTGYGEFKYPVSVRMNGRGHVIVVDFGNNRVQVLTKDGVHVMKFGDIRPVKLNGPVDCMHLL